MAIQIRSGGPAAAQARFRTSVESVLREVRRTRTGRLVLDWINRARFDVIIEPNLGAGDHDNAFEHPASRVHAGNARLGTAARGTRSIVEFSPNRLSGRGVQFQRHEVLLHELCHSLRSIYGRSRFNAAGQDLPMNANFTSVEEFFAIMVTSVHSSELGRQALGNHGSWALPSVERLRQAPFSTRLREFNQSMPLFCKALRDIPADQAAFNPFRDIAGP